jgi:hypothetical protein
MWRIVYENTGASPSVNESANPSTQPEQAQYQVSSPRRRRTVAYALRVNTTRKRAIGDHVLERLGHPFEGVSRSTSSNSPPGVLICAALMDFLLSRPLGPP